MPLSRAGEGAELQGRHHAGKAGKRRRRGAHGGVGRAPGGSAEVRARAPGARRGPWPAHNRAKGGRAPLARGLLSVPAMVLVPALLLAPVLAAAPLRLAQAPPEPAPTAAPDPAAAALRALALASAGDPSVAEVQRAAARVATPPAAPSGLARRARLAGLLPRLTAEVRHDEQELRVVGLQGSGEVDYARSSPGTGVLLRATWDLGELAAARLEVSAGRAEQDLAERREAAVARATALYFERRRLRAGLLLAPPGTAEARVEAELALAKATAELDGLTGGLLSRGGRP